MEVEKAKFSSRYRTLSLRLPPVYLEVIKPLKKGQRVHVRGIIELIEYGFIILKYVDIELAD